MINAFDAILYQRPKTVDGVCMAVAHHVDVVRVKDFFVTITHFAKSVVDWIFVRIKFRAFIDFILNNREKRLALGIRNSVRFDLPVFPSGNSYNGSFIRRAASAFSASRPTEVRLVNFDFPIHRVNIFGKHLADFLAHSPSRFVGNASLALDLLGGNSTASLSHEIDCIEPSRQRGAGLVEDSSGSR